MHESVCIPVQCASLGLIAWVTTTFTIQHGVGFFFIVRVKIPLHFSMNAPHVKLSLRASSEFLGKLYCCTMHRIHSIGHF